MTRAAFYLLGGCGAIILGLLVVAVVYAAVGLATGTITIGPYPHATICVDVPPPCKLTVIASTRP